jgi:hypothetical protein
LRAVERSGSWWTDANPMHLPPFRASVSSPSRHSGRSAGTQRSAKWNTTSPTASSAQAARPKNRWKTETCLPPTPPAASTIAVTVRRPRQCTQPAMISRKLA